MTRHELEEGASVFDEGDAGGSIFFVTQGLLEVRVDNAKLGLVFPGQCLGEFSFPWRADDATIMDDQMPRSIRRPSLDCGTNPNCYLFYTAHCGAYRDVIASKVPA